MEGYIVFHNPGHPVANSRGNVRLHRQIACDAGMLVNLRDHVHHKNGIKDDNRIENLEVVSPEEHNRIHKEAGDRKWSKERRGAYRKENHHLYGKALPEETKEKVSRAIIELWNRRGRKGWIDQGGYKVWKINGEVFWEHRRTCEIFLGRKLHRSEFVGHLNGNRLDNRPENLFIVSRVKPENYFKNIKKLRKFKVTWLEIGRILGGGARVARSHYEKNI